MNPQEMLQLVREKLEELYQADEELLKQTTPPTPRPRFRCFRFTKNITFPAFEAPKHGQRSHWRTSIWHCKAGGSGRAYYLDFRDAAEAICNDCRWQPRLILRAICRIEAAIAWCRKRREGRLREAEEILRQQSRWAKKLRQRQALGAMARLGGQT